MASYADAVPQTAYFGPQGTFTEQAAVELAHRADYELIPLPTVFDVVAAVRDGRVESGCVPVENSVEGAVPATMDALAIGEPVVAVAETVLPVRFSVLVRPDTQPEQIRTVASHPHALAQVREWLSVNLPDAMVVASSSTASAAQAVLHGEFDAAVSAPVAVRHYPLYELATGVADVTDAATRFLLIMRPGRIPEPTGADRTSIVAVTANRTGALAEVLTELSLREINLTRLEARPTKDRFGEYRFFLDVEGHIAEHRIGDALSALHRRCTEVRFLGSYPRADAEVIPVQAPATDEHFVAADDWLAAVRQGKRA